MSEKKPSSSAHIPRIQEEHSTRLGRLLKALFYDLLMLFCNIVLYIFFREVRLRNSFNVPKKGATIVVVAPHANQFVDGAIIMSRIRNVSGRNTRPIIAESSYKDPTIGPFARLADSIPVARAQDNLKFVEGEVYCKDGDYQTLYGRGTKFTQLEPKGLLGLPESAGNIDIESIKSDTELRLRKAYKTPKAMKLLDQGTRFKYAAKISNDEVFQHVFNALHQKGLIAIFPEGGSHDRPDLLPIKAGFAIMALGAVAADPTCPVTIIPTGLNYFHRNEFRSRAVVEFGAPIKVTAEDGAFYKENPREAVAKLLEEVTTALKSVTVTAPDFETLQVAQAARRLYAKKVPLSLSIEINRNLVIGYTHYKDDPRIVHLKQAVLDYNRDLDRLGLKDHQVELMSRNRLQSFAVLIMRVFKILFLVALALPGTLLFAPIFIVTDWYSKKKQRAALAKSVVKIKAVDIIATWKILVATIFAPSLYITYSLAGLYLTKKYDILGGAIYHPIPLFIAIYLVLVLTTWSAFRTGETGMDIIKSLPPLFNSVFGNEKELKQLKETRAKLSLEITELINDLGPKLFPDFDDVAKRHRKYFRSVPRSQLEDVGEDAVEKSRGRKESAASDAESLRSSSVSSGVSNGLSRVNSEGNLSDIPIFSEGGYGYYSTTSEEDLHSETDYDRIDSPKRIGSDEDVNVKLRRAFREKIEAEVEKQQE